MRNVFPFSLVYCWFFHLGLGGGSQRGPCSLLLVMRACELSRRGIEFSNAPAALIGALLGKRHEANGDRGEVLMPKILLPFSPREKQSKAEFDSRWRCKNNDRYGKGSQLNCWGKACLDVRSGFRGAGRMSDALGAQRCPFVCLKGRRIDGPVFWGMALTSRGGTCINQRAASFAASPLVTFVSGARDRGWRLSIHTLKCQSAAHAGCQPTLSNT